MNHQKPISEIASQPEMFVPTDEEKSQGKFAVVFEVVDENGEPDPNSMPHIIPTFGRNHLISQTECWCAPRIEKAPHGGEYTVCVHTGSQ